jgi:hypothetical protein
LTGNHKFYILGKHFDIIEKMLKFKLLEIVTHYTKYGQDFLDNETFVFIPDIRKLKLDTITEKNFYKLINLNDELKLLNNSIKNSYNELDEKRKLLKNIKKLNIKYYIKYNILYKTLLNNKLIYEDANIK